MLKRLLLFSSLLFALELSAQKAFPYRKEKKLKAEAIRLGIDPVKSVSIAIKEKNPDNHLFFYRSFETSVELVGNIRPSLITEAGFTSAHRRIFNSTLDYFSEGWFGRFGINYRLTEDAARYEGGIGWRVGINRFTENSMIRLSGEAWDTESINTFSSKGSTIWGEVVFYHIQPLFHSEHPLKNLWIGVDGRIKLMNRSISSDHNYFGYSLPGYGIDKKIMAGIHFRLCYHIQRRPETLSGRKSL